MFNVYFLLLIVLKWSPRNALTMHKYSQEHSDSVCKHGLLDHIDTIRFFCAVPYSGDLIPQDRILFKVIQEDAQSEKDLEKYLKEYIIAEECTGGENIRCRKFKDKLELSYVINATKSLSGAILHVTRYGQHESDEISDIQTFPEIYDVTDATGQLFINGQGIAVNGSQCETEVSGSSLSILFKCESQATPCLIEIVSSASNESHAGENVVFYNTEHNGPPDVILNVTYAACRLDNSFKKITCRIKKKIEKPIGSWYNNLRIFNVKSNSDCEHGVLSEIDTIEFNCAFPNSFKTSMPDDRIIFPVIKEGERSKLDQYTKEYFIAEECNERKHDLCWSRLDTYFTYYIMATKLFNGATLKASLIGSTLNETTWKTFPEIYDISDATGQLFINGQEILNPDSQCETEILGQFLSVTFRCTSKATPCLIELSSSVTSETFKWKNYAFFNADTELLEIAVDIKYAPCRLDISFKNISCKIKVKSIEVVQDSYWWRIPLLITVFCLILFCTYTLYVLKICKKFRRGVLTGATLKPKERKPLMNRAQLINHYD